MNGLRVYTHPVGSDMLGGVGVFYSRRADGPFYRWRCEVGTERWRFSRVQLSHLALRELRPARWNTVPTALRTRLDDHYLE